MIKTVLDEEKRGMRRIEGQRGKRNEEEGGTRRKEGRGGRRDEESEKRKRCKYDRKKDALCPAVHILGT